VIGERVGRSISRKKKHRKFEEKRKKPKARKLPENPRKRVTRKRSVSRAAPVSSAVIVSGKVAAGFVIRLYNTVIDTRVDHCSFDVKDNKTFTFNMKGMEDVGTIGISQIRGEKKERPAQQIFGSRGSLLRQLHEYGFEIVGRGTIQPPDITPDNSDNP